MSSPAANTTPHAISQPLWLLLSVGNMFLATLLPLQRESAADNCIYVTCASLDPCPAVSRDMTTILPFIACFAGHTPTPLACV